MPGYCKLDFRESSWSSIQEIKDQINLKGIGLDLKQMVQPILNFKCVNIGFQFKRNFEQFLPKLQESIKVAAKLR